MSRRNYLSITMTLRRTLSIVLLLAASCALQACGGGGNVSQPPPAPVFITIDPMIGPTAINASGEIVGSSGSSNVLTAQFRTPDGTATNFQAPEANTTPNQVFVDGTEAFDINAAGTIVGSFFGPGSVEQGYIRTSDGTFTILDVPGSFSTVAQTVNDNGQVAGTFNKLNESGTHCFLRNTDGTFVTFDTPGAAPIPVGFLRLDNAGIVAGTFATSDLTLHGFLRASDGTLTVLDAPGAGTTMSMGTILGTQITGVNDTGVVVGVVRMLAGTQVENRSFVRSSGGTYTLFDPPGTGSASSAVAISASGVIIGWYLDANSARHGYLRNSDGNFVTFDDPNAAELPISPTVVDTFPAAINASGAIVGDFSDPAGSPHGFLRQ
jgi:uncharacterized membrane protein